MVLECPFCHGAVGEESCSGCQQATPFYVCSRCHKTFANPKFKSGVQCNNCGGYIYEEPTKSVRHNIQSYVCQHCLTVQANPVFTGFHSCEGCKSPTCGVCGGVLATNSLLDYFLCSTCGAKSNKTQPL